MRWKGDIETRNGKRVRRVRITDAGGAGDTAGDGTPVSVADVMDRWQRDEGFRTFFADILADAPFAAYFWETPPVTRETATRPFEFVLVDAPALSGPAPDPRAFAAHFEAAGADADVAAFANLGGDAFLVAPTPRAAPDAYPHLAAFSRRAPRGQRHAFWRAVGHAMTARLGDRPLWLSTSGLGIAWLHARLDTRPKYYTFEPYRRHPADDTGDSRP